MITISDIKSIRIAVAGIKQVFRKEKKLYSNSFRSRSWSLDIINRAHLDRISYSMRTLYRLADRGIFKKEDLQKSK